MNKLFEKFRKKECFCEELPPKECECCGQYTDRPYKCVICEVIDKLEKFAKCEDKK